MKKLKTPTAVVTAILTLITIFFWAGFEIYHALTTKPAPPVPAEIINPLDPTLNTKSLDSISQRLFLSDTQIGNTQAQTPTPVPTQTPSPTPNATASATPVASPSATP